MAELRLIESLGDEQRFNRRRRGRVVSQITGTDKLQKVLAKLTMGVIRRETTILSSISGLLFDLPGPPQVEHFQKVATIVEEGHGQPPEPCRDIRHEIAYVLEILPIDPSGRDRVEVWK
jgi:hypothetical protein